MVIRLRGFPPLGAIRMPTSTTRPYRCALIALGAPWQLLPLRQGPQELECSAPEPPAICDEACADAIEASVSATRR